jgi:hypothetical protein
VNVVGAIEPPKVTVVVSDVLDETVVLKDKVTLIPRNEKVGEMPRVVLVPVENV